MRRAAYIRQKAEFDSLTPYHYRNRKEKLMALGGPTRKKKTISIIARDGDTCHYCHVVLTNDSRTLEHITPLSQGGTSALTNLVLACKKCNQLRADMDYEEFLLILPALLEAREDGNLDGWYPFRDLAL